MTLNCLLTLKKTRRFLKKPVILVWLLKKTQTNVDLVYSFLAIPMFNTKLVV